MKSLIRRYQYPIILILFFLSGTSALIYEVLWMKQLGLLFGNTAQAAATTLTAFFLGLALGGYFFGRISAKLENPLQTYGKLELAAAISVLGYFYILDAYTAFYPALFAQFEKTTCLFILIKLVLSIVILFPPAFFLGGTLPVISQYVVRSKQALAANVSVLYGVNTLGAALGALLAGFFLPNIIGYTQTYWVAITCTTIVGLGAILISIKIPDDIGTSFSDVDSERPTGSAIMHMSVIKVLAFLSGFGTLCLQVLWTRMFAQVLQNSVYTFASIVVVFLLWLAVGAYLSKMLIRWNVERMGALFWLLTGSGICTAFTPLIFDYWTDGLRYIGLDADWGTYLFDVFKLEFGIMAIPLVLLGAVFPYLIKIAEPLSVSAGDLVGRLVAWNTVGAIIGSFSGGFIVLETMGLYPGIRFVVMIYLLTGLYLISRYQTQRDWKIAASSVAILLLLSIFDTSRLPIVKVDPVNNQESLLEVWESAAGTVAVIRRKDSLKIKVNNYYTLGGTGSRELEELEGYLPILLHPKAESVFFLGLGTGISAGSTLRFPIKKLTVAELIPDVVNASEKYFGRFNNRLFFDPRVRVFRSDGRNLLAAGLEHYDVIIADLFVPWRAGVGSLYTLEHYRSVYDSLTENGLFMQWLPAYQLSEFEFLTISRTMTQVFKQVTLWRGDFSAKKPVIGLLGQLRYNRYHPTH